MQKNIFFLLFLLLNLFPSTFFPPFNLFRWQALVIWLSETKQQHQLPGLVLDWINSTVWPSLPAVALSDWHRQIIAMPHLDLKMEMKRAGKNKCGNANFEMWSRLINKCSIREEKVPWKKPKWKIRNYRLPRVKVKVVKVSCNK